MQIAYAKDECLFNCKNQCDAPHCFHNVYLPPWEYSGGLMDVQHIFFSIRLPFFSSCVKLSELFLCYQWSAIFLITDVLILLNPMQIQSVSFSRLLQFHKSTFLHSSTGLLTGLNTTVITVTASSFVNSTHKTLY